MNIFEPYVKAGFLRKTTIATKSSKAGYEITKYVILSRAVINAVLD